MTNMLLEKSYTEACQSANVEIRRAVVEALKKASTSGELDVSSLNLPLWSWQTIANLLATTSCVRILNLSNCLVPPRGLSAMFTAISRGTSIEELDLKGNNIQSASVSQLGKMIRYNISLKKMSLEWNRIGIFPDTFTLFCDSLATNQTLEALDLKNNQLNADCAPALANALAKNASLKFIDLRWNNIGSRGGDLLLSALQCNQSLVKVKLQGNCVPLELASAIDQCISRNATRATLLEECAQRTEILSEQLRKAEEERLREIHNLTQHSEEKVHHIIKASQGRMKQMENQLQEKEKYISELQKQVKEFDDKAQKRLLLIQQFQTQLKIRENDFQELLISTRKEGDDLRKELIAKDKEISAMQSEIKIKVAAENKLRLALEAVNLSQAEEIAQLEGQLLQAKDRIVHARKQLEEQLEQQKMANQELLDLEARENEKKLTHLQADLAAQRSSLQMRVGELERALEEKERIRQELSTALSRERGRREEEVSSAVHESKIREKRRKGENKLCLVSSIVQLLKKTVEGQSHDRYSTRSKPANRRPTGRRHTKHTNNMSPAPLPSHCNNYS